MDGCPLGLGLVVEDKPTEFSCKLLMLTLLILVQLTVTVDRFEMYTGQILHDIQS